MQILYLGLRRADPHSLGVGHARWRPPKGTVWKGVGRNHSASKDLICQDLCQVVTVNINSEVMLRVWTVDMMWWTRHLVPWIFSGTRSPVLAWGKHQTNSNGGEGIDTRYRSGTPQHCPDHQNDKHLRNCHSEEELKETWGLKIAQDPREDPGTEKGQ